MADYTKTVTNSINCFGPAPSDKWGSPYNWGGFLWGEGTIDLIVSFNKLISNTQDTDSTAIKNLNHVFAMGSISGAMEMSSETLRDPAGYYHILTAPAIDAENSAHTTYTSSSNNSTTWTSAAAGSTTWT